MFPIKKQSFFLYQLIIISHLLFACGVNKISYCNQIMLNINEANTLISQYKNPADRTATEKLVQQLNQVFSNLNKIKPRDPELQKIIVTLTENFQNLSKGLTEINQSLKNAEKAPASVTGRQQFEQAKSQISNTTKNINDLAKRQEKLTSELIVYCQK
jgi:uncharacterized phage infection (PIP) family protein YhgE